MRVLVTGAQGFIGKNLVIRLKECSDVDAISFTRGDSVSALDGVFSNIDVVVHLAGINRPQEPEEFIKGNADLTAHLCDAIKASKRRIPVILASSIQAGLDNPYGKSKRIAEQAVERLFMETDNPALIYRLPNVFGKWCRPNYNSVVATFCHNMAHDLPVQVHDPGTLLRLVYIDDVIDEIISKIRCFKSGFTWGEVSPVYSITLGALAAQIELFKNCRSNLIIERVGCGLVRALYATYVSYLPVQKFSYALMEHADNRGTFVEMLKTADSGQFSFFTAHPGVTRGGHYHHSKTEKFLVLKGEARFGFRNILTNKIFELNVSGDRPEVVETIPGWTHDITNIGKKEMVVMLWANEVFDKDHPDTIASQVYEKT